VQGGWPIAQILEANARIPRNRQSDT